MPDPFSLELKKILVFGADNEIGAEVIRACLSRDAFVTSVSLAGAGLEIAGKLGSESEKYVSEIFDYNNLAFLEDFIKDESKCTGFDGLVFCAGIGGARPLSATNHDFALKMMQQNALLFIECVRQLVKANKLHKNSAIVAMSSVSSIKGLKSKIAYSASKAALEAAVRGMAAELAIRQIRVNAIQKGWVTSDMNLDFIKNNQELNKNEDLRKQLLGPIEPRELAQSVIFLLSEASCKITGITLLVDGGYTL